MTLSNFVAYVKQAWKNKPDVSTPLSAERLLHMEEGIKRNSDAIEEIAAAVVSQIVNDPNKIASMAALYAVNQSLTTLNSNFGGLKFYTPSNIESLGVNLTNSTTNQIYTAMPSNSVAFLFFNKDSALMTEFGVSDGGTILLYKYTNWRGFGYASLTTTSNPIRFGNIATAANTISWHKAATV